VIPEEPLLQAAAGRGRQRPGSVETPNFTIKRLGNPAVTLRNRTSAEMMDKLG